MFKTLREKYDKDPVRTGPMIGALIGAVAALSVTIISLLLHFTDVTQGGGESHYGLLIGFVILPLTFLAGAPWSLIGLVASQSGHGHSALAIYGGVIGLIINGSLFGWAVGARAKRRAVRK
jgi:hypothetical protein